MGRTRLAFPPLLLACAISAGLLAPVAEAKRGPCIPGQKKPTCRIWKAKVFTTADGDTFNAKIRERGRWSKRKDIRLLGVQAMELTDYSRAHGRKGECHGVEAAERLEDLLQGPKTKRRIVRLAAFRAGSKTEGARGRLRRGVAYRSGGRWHDAGSVLMREGHAIWDPNAQEWAFNRLYAKLAADAARKGLRVWDPDACKAGPYETSVLRMKIKWDAIGNDGQNVNGEWVRITNTDPVNIVTLKGWYVRDAYLRRYEFPKQYKFPQGAVLPPGESVRVHVGRGRDDPKDFYWGEPESIFQNVDGGQRATGDGAYLYDPDGDLRSYVQYPCQSSCSEPLKGKVTLEGHPRAPESVTVTNKSNETINLYEYEVESVPYFYEFAPTSVLLPGESITINIKGNPSRDTPFLKAWGLRDYILGDKSDVISLRNPTGAPFLCDSWGRGPRTRCPGV
jgi:endonuclease YncB( thermonuclease family)